MADNKKSNTGLDRNKLAESVLHKIEQSTFQKLCGGYFTSLEIPFDKFTTGSDEEIELVAKLLDEKLRNIGDETEIRFTPKPIPSTPATPAESTNTTSSEKEQPMDSPSATTTTETSSNDKSSENNASNSGTGFPSKGDTPAFANVVYDEIAATIGGTNDNQFLSLQIPGTILFADDYRYDVENNAPKPPMVEANESRLANKMFDPCRITGGDNGFSLPYQYESALDILSPKLNKNVADFKNKLRQLLLNEYSYDFGDGEETKSSMQEVYFKLYNDYLDSVNAWKDEQKAKQESLSEEFPDNTEFKNEYLKWFEENAEKRNSVIDQKLAKILSVFSPTDMKILEGVLDSGSGAELQESRQALKRVRKMTPTGGYIYPVRMNPPDWFNKIGSSFTPTDLMKTPEYLSADLQDNSIRRMQLCSYIENMGLLRKDPEIVELYDAAKRMGKLLDSAIETATKKIYELSEARNSLNFDKSTKPTLPEIRKLLFPATDLQASLGKESRQLIYEKLRSRESSTASPIIALDDFAKIEVGQITRASNCKISYVNMITQLKNRLNRIAHPIDPDQVPDAGLASILDPVAKQFDQVNEKIDKLTQEINYATGLINSTREITSSKAMTPSGFTQINIEREMIDIINESASASSSGVNANGVNFLFFGRSTKYKSSNSSSILKKFEKCHVSISMNVTKVGIERDWFNPGIFALTRDMIKLGSSMIAPAKSYDGITEQRLIDMKDCLFPCYPVAMVIARDMSISFEFLESEDISEQYKFIEKQALSGSGFLLFSNMTGNTTMQQSSSHVSIQGKSIVVRNDATQLIGHYLEATRPDESTSMDTLTRHHREGRMNNVASISEFVGDYKDIINKSHAERRRWRSNAATQGESQSTTSNVDPSNLGTHSSSTAAQAANATENNG